MSDVIFIDFETYYNTADNYTLKKISMLEYIKSPKFKAFGMGVSINGEKPYWVRGQDIPKWCATIKWPEVSVCAQNVKFDGAILRWIYECTPKNYLDTLSMSRAIIGPKLPNHSLATVAGYFQLSPKGFLKTDGLETLTPEQEKELSDYCLHDVELCAEIYKRLEPLFPKNQIPVMDWTIRCFIEPILQLDSEKLRAVYEGEKARRAQIFEKIGIEKSVFSSNQKFAALLAKRGYEVPLKSSPKTGKKIPALSITDEGFIELRNSGNPELEELCEARIAAKSNILETRSEKFLQISTLGSFPFDLNFSGAVNTHRFSGANGAGGNPQNLPRGSVLREAIGAPAGHKLVVADFSAIELRMVAWLAREQKLIDPIVEGRDVYCEFASKIYQRSITKADKIERQFGKCAILGLGYGMGPKKFSHSVRVQTGMEVSQEEAERVVALYRIHYKRVPGLWKLLEHYIPFIANGTNVKLPGMAFLEIKDKCVVLPSGLRLQYPNLRLEGDEWIYNGKAGVTNLYGGKLLENISQALAGELCKMAVNRCITKGIRPVGQVHDEILAIAKSDKATSTAALLQQSMEDNIDWWPTLKLNAEAGVGDNWLSAKK